MRRKIGSLFMMVFLAAQVLAQAQEYGEPAARSPLATVFWTWLPVLLVVGLWFYFMRKMGLGSKGTKNYIQTSQENFAKVEAHLASIARSLEEIASTLRSRP